MRKTARGKPAMNAPTVAAPLHVTNEVTNQPPPYGGHNAFIATRLEGEWSTCFGTLPTSVDGAAPLSRAQAGSSKHSGCENPRVDAPSARHSIDT